MQTNILSTDYEPVICSWDSCRHITDTTREMLQHVVLEHVRKAPGERLGDLPMRRRIEEGIGESFSVGNTIQSSLEKELADNSQDSLGAFSLPSPPHTNRTHASSSPGPDDDQAMHPNDHLERSYHSPSPPFHPNAQHESPFLYDEQTEDDEMYGGSMNGFRTPTFAEMSSSPHGTPVPMNNPPSPTDSFLFDHSLERRKRKLSALKDSESESETESETEEDEAEDEAEDEDDEIAEESMEVEQGDKDKNPDGVAHSSSQRSNSSSESCRQVEEHLTQSLQDEEGQNIAGPSNYRDHSPQPVQSCPKNALYNQPRIPSTSRVQQWQRTSTVPSLNYQYPAPPPNKGQWWYTSTPQRKRSRSSRKSSAAQSPTDPVRPLPDPFALCHSQMQIGDQAQAQEESFPLMTQAPYDSQAY